MGNHLWNVSPLPLGCRSTEQNSCYPPKSKIAVAAISRQLWSVHVPLATFTLLRMPLMIVLFQGFEVFSGKHNAIWSKLPSSWTYTLAPWVMIGVLCLAMGGWLAYGSFVLKQPGFRVENLQQVNLKGIAPHVAERVVETPAPDTPETSFQRWKRLTWNWIKKWGNRVLYYI